MKLELAVHSLKEQRAREVLEAESRERKRIGEELHESLSQILLLAKLTVSSLKIKSPVLPAKQMEIVDNSINLLNTAFDELRNISHNLTPFLLKEKGLKECVNDMLNKIGKANHCVVNFEEIGFEKRLDGFLETTLYRVIQEIFSNIIRHAGATDINCQLIKTEKDVTIMIEDNGTGFDVNQIKKSDGIGIHNIYSRIENLNGTVLIDSALGRGTIFTLIVPLKNTL
jgi:signal transduction histidine kinase